MENAKVAEFLSYFDRIRERTMRVVACIPPERIDWTYKAGKYTLGDLVRHLAAIERWMFAENAQRKPSVYPGHGLGPAHAQFHAARCHALRLEVGVSQRSEDGHRFVVHAAHVVDDPVVRPQAPGPRPQASGDRGT